MSHRRYGPYSFETAHENKLFFPAAGLTKGDLINYYEKIAETMLPYIKERPLVMQRLPDGIDGKDFFQKQVPDYFPDWIARQSVAKEGGEVCHAIVNNAATLAYLADQGCITPHIWLSRRDQLNHPDRMILDLDPPGDDFAPVRHAAQRARTLCEELKLPVYVMTTGSRGLHLVVPLECSQTFDQVREFAQWLAKVLAEKHPDALTTAIRKRDRGARIYLDVARNAYGQHGVAPYAVRARAGAPVATPLSWDEVDKTTLAADKYSIQTIFRRLGQKGDPWQGLQKNAVNLAAAQQARADRE